LGAAVPACAQEAMQAGATASAEHKAVSMGVARNRRGAQSYIDARRRLLLLLSLSLF
jgi:hypothetical protein